MMDVLNDWRFCHVDNIIFSVYCQRCTANYDKEIENLKLKTREKEEREREEKQAREREREKWIILTANEPVSHVTQAWTNKTGTDIHVHLVTLPAQSDSHAATKPNASD